MIDGMSLAESAKSYCENGNETFTKALSSKESESNLLTLQEILCLIQIDHLKHKISSRWMAIEVQDLIMRMDESIDKITKLKKGHHVSTEINELIRHLTKFKKN